MAKRPYQLLIACSTDLIDPMLKRIQKFHSKKQINHLSFWTCYNGQIKKNQQIGQNGLLVKLGAECQVWILPVAIFTFLSKLFIFTANGYSECLSTCFWTIYIIFLWSKLRLGQNIPKCQLDTVIHVHV